MGQRLPGKIWERHRVAILRLYLDDGERLEDVRSIMWRDHKFQASIAAYKNKLKRWEVKKRETPSSDKASVSPSSNQALGGKRHYSPLPFPNTQSLPQTNTFPFRMTDAGDANTIPESAHATTLVAESIAIPQQELEDFFSTFPLSPSALNLNDYLEPDFNDNEVQETGTLLTQLSALIQTSVNAGGFAYNLIEESIEERFSQYERQGNIQLLERVMATDLLLFGSQSPTFYFHAKRFCEVTTKTTRGQSQQPSEGLSIFGCALKMVINMSNQSSTG